MSARPGPPRAADTTVPQLRLRRRLGDVLPDVPETPGYALRTYRDGDDVAWRALLETGDFGAWPPERLGAMRAGARAPLPEEAIFFAIQDTRIVAGACLFLHEDADGPIGEVGWVVVAPAHRGCGLGRAVCVAVLREARRRGLERLFLKTEDFRRPAIRLYRSLGFEPEMTDPAHPVWWATFESDAETR